MWAARLSFAKLCVWTVAALFCCGGPRDVILRFASCVVVFRANVFVLLEDVFLEGVLLCFASFFCRASPPTVVKMN